MLILYFAHCAWAGFSGGEARKDILNACSTSCNMICAYIAHVLLMSILQNFSSDSHTSIKSKLSCTVHVDVHIHTHKHTHEHKHTLTCTCIYIYGTTQMQLHTRECQTRELNIVIREWIVMTRKSYVLWLLTCSILCVYLVLKWFTHKLHIRSVYTRECPKHTSDDTRYIYIKISQTSVSYKILLTCLYPTYP